VSDGVDDLVGGLGPFEGLSVVVPELDPLFERAGQLIDGAENTAVQAAALQFGEPPLHLYVGYTWCLIRCCYVITSGVSQLLVDDVFSQLSRLISRSSGETLGESRV
jgi:hypothetical protein